MSTRVSPSLSSSLQRPRVWAVFARSPLPILAACLLWGSTGTVASFAPRGAHPAAVGCAGLVFGGFLMVLTTRGTLTIVRGSSRRARAALAVGAVAVAGYPLTFYPAVARTGVAVATVIALGSAPVFAGLLERTAAGGRWYAATGAAVAGCALLVLGRPGGGAAVDALGVGLALAAGLSYAVYATIGARLIAHGHPARSGLAVMFGGAALLVLPLVAVDGGWIATGRGAAVALHLSVLTTCVAYTLFGLGLRHTTASVATALTLAEPAAAAVLGVVVLGEQPSVMSWGGMAVVGLALAVLTKE